MKHSLNYTRVRRPIHGFTLIELLVVISIIALLLSMLMPALHKVKELASGAVCLNNQKSLITGWVMYADQNDAKLISPLACYDVAQNAPEAWVYQPRDITETPLPTHPAPATITDEDRFRGIRKGTLWPYMESLDVYHCPGDKRGTRRLPPGNCFRSYSISYAFGFNEDVRPDFSYNVYEKISDVFSPGQYYVFVEEEHNGSRYGANEGGWALLPATEQFYDPLASYHNEASTFSFADGHAEKRKWTDKRTLEFIVYMEELAATGQSFSGKSTPSPNNEDLKWLIKHLISGKRR